MEKKKVLILAYDFPPYISVGGLRPYSWFEYLNESDVFPIVVTRQWGNKYGNHLDYVAQGESNETLIEENDKGLIIRTPYKPNLSNRLLLKHGEFKYRFFRRLITAFFEFAQFLFLIGTKSGIYYGAKEYLENNKVDIIVATGEPFILFKYASKLSAKFQVPWIADYRDVWSQLKSRSDNYFLKKWNTYFECKWLKNASHVTTVSSLLISIISKNIKKPFSVIQNGFDTSFLEKAEIVHQNSEVLNIGFVGSIYDWHPIEIVLKSLNDFLLTNPNNRIKLNLYGINCVERIEYLVNHSYRQLLGNYEIFPKMANRMLLDNMSKNNVLLLFNYYSTMGTKIYDYLVVKRLILFCFTEDVEALELKRKYYPIDPLEDSDELPQVELIKNTNSGTIIKNSFHLKVVLSDLITELSNQGFIACNSVGVENFSRRNQVGKLANLLKQTIDENKSNL